MTAPALPTNLAELLKANVLRAQLPPDMQAACDRLVASLHETMAAEPVMPVRLLALEIMRQQTVTQARQVMADMTQKRN